MAEGTVRADLAFLDQLHQSIARTSCDLGAGKTVPRSDLGRAPEVQQAWNELYDRWDENQRKLTENLDVIGRALRGIIDAFQSCDQQLTASLTEPA